MKNQSKQAKYFTSNKLIQIIVFIWFIIHVQNAFNILLFSVKIECNIRQEKNFVFVIAVLTTLVRQASYHSHKKDKV